jgi:FixJ family two-component response regulator
MMREPAADTVLVLLVDDEPAVTDALTWLLESVAVSSQSFTSATALLEALPGLEGPICAVVDLRMPEMSGLELQQRLNEMGCDLPIIFLTAHGDVPAAVRAMQGGAVDFVQKPFNPDAFLASVFRMVRVAKERFEQRRHRVIVAELVARLTPREREVLAGLLRVQTSKQIATKLGMSPKTVDVHRANLMKKLMVSNAAQLAELFDASAI